MLRLSVVVALIAVVLGGCASAGGAGVAGESAVSAAAGVVAEKAAEDRLTLEEIEAAELPNAYEVVARLRRSWLRRDPETGAAVEVYMDGQRLGAASKLRQIPAAAVAELEYLPREEAVRRFGAAVEGNVIVVVRRQ